MTSNGEFKIEKGVPLSAQKRHSRYPFANMEVGDSFFVAGASAGEFPQPYVWGKRHNKRFATRTVDGGLRVWRVE